jgi:pimeloyl-ACP methyl ester carboxylesterase
MHLLILAAFETCFFPRIHQQGSKPPLLAIWGKHDPYFIPPGAEAFRRDNPDAVVHLLDTGHFALETHLEEVAARMRQFLVKSRW